jgi:hypothetical protein
MMASGSTAIASLDMNDYCILMQSGIIRIYFQPRN